MTDSEFRALMRAYDRLRDLERDAQNLARDIRIAKEDAGVALHETAKKRAIQRLQK